jgi:hypothetical protein
MKVQYPLTPLTSIEVFSNGNLSIAATLYMQIKQGMLSILLTLLTDCSQLDMCVQSFAPLAQNIECALCALDF